MSIWKSNSRNELAVPSIIKGSSPERLDGRDTQAHGKRAGRLQGCMNPVEKFGLQSQEHAGSSCSS